MVPSRIPASLFAARQDFAAASERFSVGRDRVGRAMVHTRLSARTADAAVAHEQLNKRHHQVAGMAGWFDVVLVLAQGGAKPQDPPFWLQMLPFALILFLLFPIVIWPQRKEQQKRDDLIKSLKKNDRVVTLGGIIGTVANISADGKEVTLKVDDNTRIKFIRTGISQKLIDAEAKDEASKPAG
jgi:preprotein translocase subunit YajC